MVNSMVHQIGHIRALDHAYQKGYTRADKKRNQVAERYLRVLTISWPRIWQQPSSVCRLQ